MLEYSPLEKCDRKVIADRKSKIYHKKSITQQLDVNTNIIILEHKISTETQADQGYFSSFSKFSLAFQRDSCVTQILAFLALHYALQSEYVMNN